MSDITPAAADHVVRVISEPHTVTAIWCIIAALIIIPLGWIIDQIIADIKKNWK